MLPDDKAQRDEEIWKLAKRDWTQERIAAQLGISQSTVSRTLSAIYADYAIVLPGGAAQADPE